MAGELTFADAVVPLNGDRGVRTVQAVPLMAYIAFGAAAQQYQKDHPETLVRTTQSWNKRTGEGLLVIRWWPRGESEPTG